MSNWRKTESINIVKIERFVEEFELWDLRNIPHGKFKIKIYESSDGKFTGRTNLMVIDKTGNYNAGVGYGETTDDALNDTIRYFYSLIEESENLTMGSFKYVDSMDF